MAKDKIPFNEIDDAFKAAYYKKDFCELIDAEHDWCEDDPTAWDTYRYKVKPPYKLIESSAADSENVYDAHDIRYMFDLYDNYPMPGGRFDHFYINVNQNDQTFTISHRYGYDC